MNMDGKMKAQTYFNNLSSIIEQIDYGDVDRIADTIEKAVNAGNWVFTCGNGGSALTASHFITDWAKMRWVNNKQKFKGMCLNDNIGMLTAYANDLSYSDCFQEPLSNYANKGDILICVSGSGNSSNVVKAAERAKELGVTTIALVGFDGGLLKKTADITVHVNSDDMQFCEDIHLSIGHVLMKQIC
jgi:D-sedoheptulose 7-phosphate isomerase